MDKPRAHCDLDHWLRLREAP